MAMDEGDKAIVRELAYEVGEILIARLVKQVRLFLVGIALGSAIVGSTGTLGLLKIFKFI